MQISESELEALKLASTDVLTSKIIDKSEKDVFGEPIPGHTVFKKLIKKGLVFETEEDPITLDDGTPFTFTTSYCLTDAGKDVLSKQNQ